jgi:ABC-type branched-subunit amino acid transport system substrate-binding protein
LMQRIRASGARAVYLQTGTSDYLRRLRPALGQDVAVVIAAYGGLPLPRLFEEAGDEAARGVYVTIPGPSLERLGPSGQRFLRDFGATRRGRIPDWAVHGAAAAEALLDAIARSDGTRESVARNLATVDLPDSPVGPLSFQRNGEPTANPVSIVRADHGGEPYDGVLAAGGEVVDVLTPPARLVGERPRN